MNPTEIILKKRHGKEFNPEEITMFVKGVIDGSFADYQLAALLMAICIRGMTLNETAELTMAMAHSGEVLNLSNVPGVKADKHSTGGVGDTTTLILAPLLAACGVKVAKMSGRGLGFTGGTIDKLESIPGFSVNLCVNEFIECVNSVGLSIIGQTNELAPADKKLYELRDVTGTVDSLPLIASSILSKKIAAGCDVVVLDVKTGSGAMMETVEKSKNLAQVMVDIGRKTGRRFSALVTDMDQPLGQYVGNALEVEEAILTLRGECAGPLLAISLELGAQVLTSAGVAQTREQGISMLKQKLDSGEGLQKFKDMIEAQHGDSRVTGDFRLLPRAHSMIELRAEKSGYVSGIHTASIGNAALVLGAGRGRKEDIPDPGAGLIMRARLGDFIEKGSVFCELRAVSRSDVNTAEKLVRNAITLGAEPPEPKPLVRAIIE
jgi:pyrimidine-nucleoside phosphorylase